MWLAAGAVCSLGTAVYFRISRLAVEKLLTSLVLPPGLLWLGLMVAVVVAWRHKQRLQVSLLVGCWLLLTIAGNSWTSYALLAHLERAYRHLDPLASIASDQPLNAVAALGGATMQTPAGQVQLTGHGDRVLLAARLYRQGACRQLVAAGQAMDDEGDERSDPSEETAILWRDLGIPDDDILLVGGHNTREELSALKQVAALHGWQRIGVVTSAFHMARAMRLARDEGLEVVPLPAQFLSAAPSIHRLSVIPAGDNLATTSLALKELLAAMVGR
jgi:uncharacterized SAM-binding protein YcdF (DUF218 family)